MVELNKWYEFKSKIPKFIQAQEAGLLAGDLVSIGIMKFDGEYAYPDTLELIVIGYDEYGINTKEQEKDRYRRVEWRLIEAFCKLHEV